MPTVHYGQALNELATEIYTMAESKGFWDQEDIGNLGILPLKLALITDECSEALQVFRKEYDDSAEDPIIRMTEMQAEDFEEEVADIIIRALDLAAAIDLDIGAVVMSKMEKNASRPFRHGKRF